MTHNLCSIFRTSFLRHMKHTQLKFISNFSSFYFCLVSLAIKQMVSHHTFYLFFCERRINCIVFCHNSHLATNITTFERNARVTINFNGANSRSEINQLLTRSTCIITSQFELAIQKKRCLFYYA